MKSIGIVRKLDNLGRIVLPIELRKTLHYADNEALEIFTEGDSIVLRKYETSCIFCGNSKNITSFKNKCVCQKCIEKLSNEK